MTDHHDALDELASAHLDGQTTPAEAALIAADPELTARVDRLAAARDTLRAAEVPIDPIRRDQAVAAALAAFDEDANDRSPALAAARVTPLAPAAARWGRAPRRALALVGIAAAVALLALAVPFIERLDSGSNDDLAAQLDKASDDVALRDATGGAAGTAGDAAPSTALSTASGVGAPDLGPFSDLPGLADAVRGQLGATAAMESSPEAVADGGDRAGAEPIPCADEQAAGGPVVYTALADLDGQLVVVMVREASDGVRTLVVLDRQDCSTVAAGRL